MADQNSRTPDRRKLRSAIYTRKSSEEGLEQDFNSLDAQREACAAFIASQKREGWLPIPELYDDGGYSGATIERPAFQRLLSDVRAGKVDIVVVYKVDRLTRSLSDFAKIVDIFDKHSASFVSVTQQFNTTTSMGRLTLNILLSFAQFEREVTGERIRDKIAASKKRGLWMGGQPPLGYDAKDRTLAVNEPEAKLVQQIFRRYLDLKSVRQLKSELDAQAIVSKIRKGSDGSLYGGKPIARGALYLMLQNRIYRGEIVHRDKSYPGAHKAIIDEALWNNVQKVLIENRVNRENGITAKEPSLLAGKLFDACDNRMTPTHATKRGTRYRYYISKPLLEGGNGKRDGQRVPAIALEALVIRRVRDWLTDAPALLGTIQGATSASSTGTSLIARAKQLAGGDRGIAVDELRKLVRSVTVRVQLHPQYIDIVLDVDGVCHWLDGTANSTEFKGAGAEADCRLATISVPAELRRAGKEMRIIVADAKEPAAADASLVRLLVRGHTIRDRLFADPSRTLEDIARSEGIVPSYATRLFRLTLLAPDIIAAILSGRQPPELTARKLMDDTRLPLDWAEQRRSLRFAAAG